MIDARLRVPGQPGWRSDEADVGFDQNSHMHFLEALLTLDALPSGTGVAGDVRARIVEILRLLADRLVAPGTAAIREWFDDRWAVPEGRDVVEPGHLYEWAWLLAQAGRQGFAPRIEGARLHAFADTHGWHPHRRLIVDSCREDGEWISPDHRLWPHCEAIRAATVLADADAGHRMAQHIAARMMDVFLDRPFAGGWIDRVDADLQPAASAVPATSLYHLWEAGLALVRAGWAQLPHQVASC
jgi:mannose-6-phosphate isomerase